MGIKSIQGISIMVEVGMPVVAPTQLPVLLETDNYDLRAIINWSPSNPNYLDTSVAGDHVYVATVNGTGNNTAVVSVVVGRPEESNPKSVFPDQIDDFGLPKTDIETSDIPAIDAYEFLKAKNPRHIGEDYALHQYRELLHMKMILARDINHARNAIIEIEKYLKNHPFSDYYNEMTNIGRGAEVYAGFDQNAKGKNAEFRTLRGGGMAEVDELSREIEIFVPDLEEGENITIEKGANSYVISSTASCELDCDSHPSVGSINICPNDETSYNTWFTNDGIGWNSFNWKMLPLKGGYANSLLMRFGTGVDVNTRNGQGFMLKAQKTFIIEMKTVGSGGTRYEGIELGNGTNDFYSSTRSKIREALLDEAYLENY